MAQFNDALMLLVMKPTRYLSIRDCVNLERVSNSASDITRLCYPVVTDLGAFGITDQMTHNAFSELPRHCGAFFRRFDCNKLTSLRVPWNPQTIVINNGITYRDARMLVEKCPNLVELPPVDAKFDDSIGFDNMLLGAQKRSLQSVTLYSDLSHYKRNKLLNSYMFNKSETRASSTSVCRLEIVVKIPFNVDYAINVAFGAFIRFINLRFDISAVTSLKVFIASNFKFEDRRDDDSHRERLTCLNLPDMLEGWTSLEELSITIEHATAYIVLDGLPELNLKAFPSLRTFSIVQLHCASVYKFEGVTKFCIADYGTVACMPALRHLNIGSLMYFLHDRYEDSLTVQTRKEILQRKISILNESKIQRVQIGTISKEVATPAILDQIGESRSLRQFTIRDMSVTTETLLNILKRNKDLEFVGVIDCNGITDELFTLLAQAQLRNVTAVSISQCSREGIRRYVKWRIRQIKSGHALAHVKLASKYGKDLATVFPNMNLEEVLENGRITPTETN